MLKTWHGIKRFAERARRRVRHVIGRPDNSPWIMEPHCRRREAYIDLMFGLDYLSPNSGMVDLLGQALAPYGLRFLLVNRQNVESVVSRVRAGSLHPHVYLDLCAEPGDPFGQLKQLAEQAGIYTISRSSDAQWILKARSHEVFERAGLPLPPSVIIPRGQPDRELTAQERALVGERVVIKPSNGFAGLGVVVGVEPTLANIAKARDFNRQDDFLVQRMISWKTLGDRPGYFRGYNVFGARAMVWWAKDHGADTYRPMTWDEARRWNLHEALPLVDRLAEMTGMDYFSTEIAVLTDDGPADKRFCIIDYCNDQCDIDPFAHDQFSPPESFCRWVYERLAEFVWRKKHGMAPAGANGYRGLFLSNG